ncbi:pilus assembly protein TadG-related protein [Lentzea sp. JNUCC 0626]|uniref:pilus assembly protein TadG-related protein n=1 Tax=Lentzea sp. JNUCC 0626 TaxID=3367513 RepID=UPI003747C9CC
MTAFVLLFVASALGLAGLVLDGGAALSTKARASGIAQEAARAGAQEIDLTAFRTDGTLHLRAGDAADAAVQFLEESGMPGRAAVVGDTVEVVIVIDEPTRLLGLIGISSLTVRGTGRASPHRDVTS